MQGNIKIKLAKFSLDFCLSTLVENHSLRVINSVISQALPPIYKISNDGEQKYGEAVMGPQSDAQDVFLGGGSGVLCEKFWRELQSGEGSL